MSLKLFSGKPHADVNTQFKEIQSEVRKQVGGRATFFIGGGGVRKYGLCSTDGKV